MLMALFPAFAEDSTNTVISEATIHKVQAAKLQYKQCAAKEMQNPDYVAMDSRKATEAIIKNCEPELGKMREIYLADKVPPEIADRHLRQLRIQTTRNALQELIFSQAARTAGQP
jgi:hypothetical protein